MQAWIDEEFATLDLGDRRLERRFRRLLEQRMDHPNLSIPASINASDTASHRAEVEAAYRLFDNDAVDDQKILEPHYRQTRARIGQERVVLVAQDTTEIDLTRPRAAMEGIGPLGGIDDKRLGAFDHALLAMTVEGVPLGLLSVAIWRRDPDDPTRQLSRADRAKIRRRTPVEEKESFRWVEGYRVCCAAAQEAEQTQIVCISDSESDIFELLQETQRDDGPRASWIIRACQDRRLDHGEDDQRSQELLFDAAQQLPKLGERLLDIRRRDANTGDGQQRKGQRSARTAQCALHAGTVTIKPPTDLGVATPTVTVHVVLMREINPPTGEPPIEWLLLTDLPIDDLDAALLVVTYYCRRWGIEVYFKVLKSGCRIESSQLETFARYRNYLALSMVVAWRIMRITLLGREHPDLPCTVVLDPDEWQAAYAVVERRPPPKTPPSLSKMIGIIAQLGGWMGRECDGPPGTQTVWIGMQRMRDLAVGWQARQWLDAKKPRPSRRKATCVE